jgi:hypothetical protein
MESPRLILYIMLDGKLYLFYLCYFYILLCNNLNLTL